ncbi:MAG: hypothetical protein Tp1125DCM238401_26 [Prokaryotic dsDNA virus sp.]|nr:MAG: hypothetical protein Tp1125DCM238401_26 [Prokaryotic dsDNA virus sp.]|tara:strand:- start:8493 stop:9110 length:618 start_codon:yes stop_codon:yes gene_type:complete
MTTKIPTGMLSSVSSKVLTTSSAANEGKLVQLNSSGTIPNAYVATTIATHQWRYTGTFAVGTGEVVVDTGDGWEVIDTTGQAVNNGSETSGMTVNEGVFSFPSTGIWLVTVNAWFTRNSSDVSLIVADLMATSGSGGSTTTRVAQGCGSVSSSALQCSVTASSLLNVSNTSDVKVKVQVSASSSGCDFSGHTSFNKSYFTFQKIS